MITRFILFIASSILGTTLHFTYKLSHKNFFVGLFSAQNESTFEHMKIALFGRIFLIPIDIHILGSNSNYYIALFFELLNIIIYMPLLYYGIKIFLKKDIAIINISIFYLTMAISNIVGTKILLTNSFSNIINNHAIIGIIFIIILNIIFSIKPPKYFIFQDSSKK